MKSAPTKTRRSRFHPDQPQVTQAVMDTFHDLWIQYEDGHWRWISLIGLIDQKPYRRLARPEVFRAGILSQDRRWIEWPKKLLLHIDHLVGTPGVMTDKGVMVRAEGDTGHGWYRPLLAWYPRQVRRQDLTGWTGPPRPDDLQLLRWLGWSDDALAEVFKGYSVEAMAAAARLLDLTLYLGVKTLDEGQQFRYWLNRPWAFSGYASPLDAIHAGDIALIERLYAAEPGQTSQRILLG